MRVVDWCLGLNFGQKIVVGVAAAVSVLLASYFASLLILSSDGIIFSWVKRRSEEASGWIPS